MNCKPGDLAIIVSSRLAPENIGRIVEVVRRRSPDGSLPCWIVRSNQPLVNRWEDGFVELVYERIYRDLCLRPVTGLPIANDVTDEVTA